jgi:MraZ protein
MEAGGLDRLFSGSGLSAVDSAGRTRLPDFVRNVLIGRGDSGRLVIGVHEKDDCLVGFDPEHKAVLHRELERRRLAGEAAGESREAHDNRARRLFGLAADARLEKGDTIVLPELPRRRGRIGNLALFVGTGGTFEIWDPAMACDAGGGDLRALAEYRLAEGTSERRAME